MKKFTALLLLLLMLGCSAVSDETVSAKPQAQNGSALKNSMELEFATEFSVDYYEDGYKLITLGDESRFLIIPEGREAPKDIDSDIILLNQPIKNIYLTATSAASFFDGLGHLDAVRLSGTRADGWYIDSVKETMQSGEMLYAGKYSEPDYELILDEGCSLAVQSTMIAKASQVKEKLEETGIAVLVDQSSHEKHPLGRAEWIKLYAALFNEEQKAQQLFDDQVKYMNAASDLKDDRKTVAFFHINSAGQVVVRRSSDYISRMIELAGGDYVFDDSNQKGDVKATETIEMESFFAAAGEADILIYNGTIVDVLETVEQLTEQNGLLADFKAVRENNVWCTTQSMFQDTMQHGKMITDFHTVFTDLQPDEGQLKYIYRLK